MDGWKEHLREKAKAYNYKTANMMWEGDGENSEHLVAGSGKVKSFFKGLTWELSLPERAVQGLGHSLQAQEYYFSYIQQQGAPKKRSVIMQIIKEAHGLGRLC